MKIVPLCIVLFLAPFACLADQSAIVYSIAQIKIIPQPGTFKPQPMPAAQPEANAQTPADGRKPANSAVIAPKAIMPLPAPVPRDTSEFSVEVRPLGILQQKEFIVHEPFSDTKGLLILVDPPQSIPLKAAPLLGKADVLLVTPDGTIAKIAPDLTLSQLDEPIDAGSPVRAFVLLQAGIAAEDDIRPGDTVQSALFKTHPVVLGSPSHTVIINNSPPPDTNQAPAPEAKSGKKRAANPQATSTVVYPLSSVPPAGSQQLMQQLQK